MLGVVLLVCAFISFVLAAAQAPIPRCNLVGLGLAFWVLTELIGALARVGPAVH